MPDLGECIERHGRTAVSVVASRCQACATPITERDHDTFEDMYTCPNPKCGNFWYPQELGLKDDPEAGYRRIGGNAP